MTDVPRIPHPDMLTRASIAVGQIDLHGKRGVTLVSHDGIEAMALLLASLGFAPTRPGDAPPADFFPHLKDR